MIRKALGLVPAEYARLTPRLLLSIVCQALAQAVAYVLLVPVLQALFDDDLDRAWWWTLWLVLAVAAVVVFGYLQSVLGLRIGVGMQHGLQTRLGDQLNALPLGWFDDRHAGELSRVVVENVREVQGLIAYLLAKMLTGVLVPLGVAVGMLFVDWRISLAMLVAAPALFAVNLWANRSYAGADERMHEAAAEANARVLEFAQAQPVLRSLGAVGAGNRALDAALARQRKAASGLLVAAVPGLIVFSLVVQAIFLVLVYLVVGRATDGAISAAAAIALIAVSSRFIEPLTQAAQLGGALRTAAAAADRVTALLSEPALPQPDSPVRPGAARIEFDGVSFGYGPGKPVLSDVTFTAEPGTTTAIVGPSGAGKSTLLRLAARFHDADSGRVAVGGHDVRDQPSETLLNQLALVFQNVYLFDRSVLENIRAGRPDASDQEVLRAGAVARVDEIAQRLPDGWQTTVGEGGSALSGGERQRVSIARALVKDAPIVLLDEATSALDPHNEAVVVRGVHELTRGRTVLVVAHRLATIAHADQILFMDGGRIVERGTHAELLALDGRYAAFWNERTRASGWRLASAAV
ncbi:ATP-binding cassette domain-containing protein [Nocardia seriolae]|uniref:ABC transporter ATP-binding protein n=1 Tax=Nocardia seriolae TaxID=37332 RepID=UPI0012BD023A|nr:ABC transporter ATP-binding protein [Nocardia seriolae]MTJ60894.1 ATP-binding cassette domain-containing protein [Nocardia seriolae]MTJ73952.1 ATP-binding cassette domain-containing protein [Nocardia seriolae]MTJ90969.1 ATP-binding cassette domain-containing protein [Nocardia seriolae]MTK34926.1 ATP-binding cassette domain-containing protein [Nocardia seriolae]MTK38876.1 ATP-binding cassette domain-containing protein [Nocardia seriolae]